MLLERFVAILRSRWRLAAAVWLGTAAVLFLMAFFSTSQYKGIAELMVEPKTVDPAAGLTPPWSAAPNHIPTEIDVIQSERVALRALRSIDLQLSETWRKRWLAEAGGEGDFEPWLAEQLLKKLDVRPSRDSNVLTLSFTSADPGLSAQIANAFVRAYIQTSVELRTDPARASNSAFDAASKGLREKLEEAQQRLSAFQQRAGLVASDERVDVENLRLLELSSQVVVLQSNAANAAGRARHGTANPETMPEVQKDPVVAALQAELEKQEGQLVERASRVGERHPSLEELRSGLAELRVRAARAATRAAAGLAMERRVADERLAEANRSLAAQRATVLRLKGQRDQATVLQREVDNAQRAFDAALTRSSQTAIETRGARANISVLKVASPPSLPSWPRPGVVLSAALLMGMILAVGAVLWREARDMRLHTVEDVTERLQQPVLAILRGNPAALGNSPPDRLVLARS